MPRTTGTRNKHPRRIWTEAEDRVIRNNYYRYGARRTAAILTNHHAPRSEEAVATRARRVLQQIGIPEGHVPLVDVDPYGPANKRNAHHRIVAAARRDGVLHRALTMHAWTYTAPATWCDQYLERLTDSQQYARWLTTRELARAFGVSVEHVRAGLRPRAQLRIRAYLEGIPRVIPYPNRQGYVWEPTAAAREAADFLAATSLARAA